VAVRATTRSQSATPAASDMSQETVDPNGVPAGIWEMTTSSRAAYQAELSVYQIKSKEYELERKAERDLKDWVQQTVVNIDIYKIACPPTKRIDEWYLNLKKST
jgi:hypothetical protein